MPRQTSDLIQIVKELGFVRLCRYIPRFVFILGTLLVLGHNNSLLSAENGRKPLPKPEELTFERHIYPILKTHCIGCHGEGKTESKLDLRQKTAGD